MPEAVRVSALMRCTSTRSRRGARALIDLSAVACLFVFVSVRVPLSLSPCCCCCCLIIELCLLPQGEVEWVHRKRGTGGEEGISSYHLGKKCRLREEE